MSLQPAQKTCAGRSMEGETNADVAVRAVDLALSKKGTKDRDCGLPILLQIENDMFFDPRRYAQRPAPIATVLHTQGLRAPLTLSRPPMDVYELPQRPQARHLRDATAPAGLPPSSLISTLPAGSPPPPPWFTAPPGGLPQLFTAPSAFSPPPPLLVTALPLPPPPLPTALPLPTSLVVTLQRAAGRKKRERPAPITPRVAPDRAPREAATKKPRCVPHQPPLEWPTDADSNLVALLRLVGFRWSAISAGMGPGYSENNVKNRWYATIRRLERQVANHGADSLLSMEDCPKNRGPLFIFARNVFTCASYDAKKVGDVPLATVGFDAPLPALSAIVINTTGAAPALPQN